MVGAIGCVGGVVITHAGSAVQRDRRLIMPDVYFNVPDYKDTSKDITGKFFA